MIEVQASVLIGPALDWAVAKAIGQQVVVGDGLPLTHDCLRVLRYSTDWAQGGPLIEKLHIDLHFTGRHWIAQVETCGKDFPIAAIAETALIAAMRAIVAAFLGDTVSVPYELMGGPA